jgi:hypothetical protein
MTAYSANSRNLPDVNEIPRRARIRNIYPIRVTVVWRNLFMMSSDTTIAVREPICMKLTKEPDWERVIPVEAMILVAKGPSMLLAMAKKKKPANRKTGCMG